MRFEGYLGPAEYETPNMGPFSSVEESEGVLEVGIPDCGKVILAVRTIGAWRIDISLEDSTADNFDSKEEFNPGDYHINIHDPKSYQYLIINPDN